MQERWHLAGRESARSWFFQERGAEVLKAVVLDFDGVVLESVDLKTRAFQKLFQDHTEHLDAITRLHQENGGISRFEKFKIIYSEYLRKPLSTSEAERLGREFAAFVMQEILTCPFVPGAFDFLVHGSKQWPIFIVSGTPEKELRRVASQRGLAQYCKGIFGSPRTKAIILSEILAKHFWLPNEVLFIGDSTTDFHAASQVGVHFIGRVPARGSVAFPGPVKLVSDFRDLDARWADIETELGL